MKNKIPRFGLLKGPALRWLASFVAAIGHVVGAGQPDPGAEPEHFFAEMTIPVLRIEIPSENVDKLRQDPRKSVSATLREDDTVYDKVAVHLKGSAGSFRTVDEKPSLTVNMDKFNEGQRFHGLDKFHLNNSVQDPSYLNELICGDLFNEAGVPCPRVTFSRVYLNGRDWGLYVLIEGFDKTFLRRHFRKHKGNLYDPDDMQDVTEPLERDSGEGSSDRSDLKGLVEAARQPDLGKRWQELHQVLDLERFLSFVAMEVITWHSDGYSMRRSNYRLYHDPETRKFIFMPHGMDQMFSDPNGPSYPKMAGLVAQAVLEIPQANELYQKRLKELVDTTFREEPLSTRIRTVQARLQPMLEQTNSAAAQEQRRHADAIQQRIAGRVKALNEFLQKR